MIFSNRGEPYGPPLKSPAEWYHNPEFALFLAGCSKSRSSSPRALRAYRDRAKLPVVSIRKNRYSTTLNPFFNNLLMEGHFLSRLV